MLFVNYFRKNRHFVEQKVNKKKTYVEQAAEPEHGEQRVHVALAREVQARAHVPARARHAMTVPVHTHNFAFKYLQIHFYIYL
jgi:hypothetical protein